MISNIITTILLFSLGFIVGYLTWQREAIPMWWK